MKMKIVSLALSGALLASSSVMALDLDPKIYVGGEVQANRLHGKNSFATKNNIYTGKKFFNRSGTGASAFIGGKLCENFGAELGYNGLPGSKANIVNAKNSVLKAKNRNMYADVLGYMPVSNEIDLIGAVGVGKLSTKITGNVVGTKQVAAENVSLKSSKAGVRVGAGVQYKLTENLNARLMVRHQQGNKFVKSINSVGLGLICQF